MLSTLLIILLVLWALGMVSSYTLGGFIHVLLVIAIVVVLIRDNRGPGSASRVTSKRALAWPLITFPRNKPSLPG